MNKNTIIIIIIIAIIAMYFVGQKMSSVEEQLALEYITFWGDDSDGTITTSICQTFDCQSANCAERNLYAQKVEEIKEAEYGCAILSGPAVFVGQSLAYYEDDKWICEGLSFGGGSSLHLSTGLNQQSPICRTKENLKGQEVVVLLSGGKSGNSGGTIGSCSISPAGNFKCTGSGKNIVCQQTVVKYIPHTFDISIYDVYQDGLKVNEISVDDELHVEITCSGAQQSGGVSGNMEFLGYKAQYECDLSEDEVWIQEQFLQPFDIFDLSFVPTKFCHSTRPFVLRVLGEGETIIREEEGIQPLNRGETIPPRAMDPDEIIIVNYAAYMTPELGNPCEANEAKIWDGSQWVCQEYIDPNTIIVNPADTNYDGKVDNSELLDYLSVWIDGGATNLELLGAISIWMES